MHTIAATSSCRRACRRAAFVLAGSLGALAPVGAGAQVTLTIDAGAPGGPIPADFSGISMEMQTLLPDKYGRYYFRAGNQPLLAMFRQLGIHNLRVGGNTADNPAVAVPAGANIDSLFAFARAAGIKVIYTLRLRGNTDPGDDAVTARYVMAHYSSDVVCFEIGNEPNRYAKTYPAYHDLMARFVDAITAAEVAPGARFCGPNTTPDKTEWARQLAIAFASSGHLALITQHAYPGGNARKVTDVVAARDTMLSRAWVRAYEKFYSGFGPTAAEQHVPYRIEETNSFYNGGRQNVSDTHAAALWALDYMYWWATHGAAGLNFHTGDYVAAADESTPCRYALFWTASDGYEAHPIAYGVKAFDLGSHGRILPVRIESASDSDLTAYATLASDGSIYLTIINKEHDRAKGTSGVTVAVRAGKPYTSAVSIRLTNIDLAATSGETLGRSAIRDDGSWSGRWSTVRRTAPGSFSVALPPGSAAVVHLMAR